MLRELESASSIKTARCPLQYFLKYVEGVVFPTGKPAKAGTAVHKAIQRALEMMRITGEYFISMEEVLEAMKEEDAIDLELAAQVYENSGKHLNALKPEEIFGTEVTFENKEAGVKAISDLVVLKKDEVIIYDHKTQRNIQDMAFDFQTMTNIIAVSGAIKREQYSIEYLFHRYGASRKYSVTPGYIQTVFVPIIKYEVARCRKIAEGARPGAIPGSYCIYCPNREKCLVEDTMSAIKSASKKAIIYGQLEKENKQIVKDRLEELEDHVEIGQENWKHKKKVEEKVTSTREALEFISANALDWEKAVTFSAENIRYLKSKGFKEIEEKISSTFSLVKVDVENYKEAEEKKGGEKIEIKRCSECRRPIDKEAWEEENRRLEKLGQKAKSRMHLCKCSEKPDHKTLELITKKTGKQPQEWLEEKGLVGATNKVVLEKLGEI